MPTIQRVAIDSPVDLGSASKVTISSTPTAGGALGGRLSLSKTNDVFFAPSRTNEQAVSANGSSSFTLVRASAPGLRSPQSVKIFTRVEEVGVSFPALDISLVNLS